MGHLLLSNCMCFGLHLNRGYYWMEGLGAELWKVSFENDELMKAITAR